MKPTNDYLTGPHTVTVGRKSFAPGRPFPAADLGLSERSFDGLIESGALVHPSKIKPADAKPDGLEKWPRQKLLDRVAELKIVNAEALSKSELIKLIRSRKR